MTIKFVDSGREPQCSPDPKFPNGMDIVEGGPATARLPHPEGVELAKSLKGPGCTFDLPYPSTRCGLLVVTCDRCHKQVGLTVAGRIDDPRMLRMACKGQGPG
jgi:hypothetical protein